jgi:hypothetical protein
MTTGAARRASAAMIPSHAMRRVDPTLVHLDDMFPPLSGRQVWCRSPERQDVQDLPDDLKMMLNMALMTPWCAGSMQG